MMTQRSKLLQKVNNIEASKLQEESFSYFGRTFLVASWTEEVKGLKVEQCSSQTVRERKFVKNGRKETRQRKRESVL